MSEGTVLTPEISAENMIQQISRENEGIWQEISPSIEAEKEKRKSEILTSSKTAKPDSKIAFQAEGLQLVDQSKELIEGLTGSFMVFCQDIKAKKEEKYLTAERIDDFLNQKNDLTDRMRQLAERLENNDATGKESAALRATNHALRTFPFPESNHFKFWTQMPSDEEAVAVIEKFFSQRGEILESKGAGMKSWIEILEAACLDLNVNRFYDPAVVREMVLDLFQGFAGQGKLVGADLPKVIGDPNLFLIIANELQNNSTKAFAGREVIPHLQVDFKFEPKTELLVMEYSDNAGGISGEAMMRLAEKGFHQGKLTESELAKVKELGGNLPQGELEDRVIEMIFAGGVSGFKLTGKEGTGLGLSDLRQRVEAEGGTFSAKNRRDEKDQVVGISFRVTKPARYRSVLSSLA